MQVRLLGVAGPSGSGKSELARRLAAALQAPVLSLDSYYHDLAHLPLEVRAKTNFDEPASIDHELLLTHCRQLLSGQTIDVPHYDFTGHTRGPGTQHVEPHPNVIVEGLFTLYWPELRQLLHASVYVDLEDAACFARRLARDVRDRGRTLECVTNQYNSTVRPMAERYIWPTRQYAGIVVRGDAVLSEAVAAALRFAGEQPVTSLAAPGSVSR
ncbi:MAG TPA: uridine kinase [Bryobacteraceae bacterium]|nr:uridine kinase [Bryobacteraceae bacterium]